MELTLICSHYFKQLAEENWKKNLLHMNAYWWHWHYFIMYTFYWKVYQVNYKEECFAWKFISKFTVSHKLSWKFARRFLTIKLPSLKVCCWYLLSFIKKKFPRFSRNCSFFITAFIICKILILCKTLQKDFALNVFLLFEFKHSWTIGFSCSNASISITFYF